MAEQEDQAQKTEPATPKRREDARKKGQVAQSRELQSVAVLGAAVIALASPLGAHLAHTMLLNLTQAFSTVASPPSSASAMHGAFTSLFLPAWFALIPFMLMLMALGALTQVVQTGPMFSVQALQPRMDRISLVQGTKRLFSGDRLFDLVKAMLKLVLVGAVLTYVLSGEVSGLLNLMLADVGSAMRLTGKLALMVAVALLLLLAPLALLDLAYQRFRYEQRLKMTRREVRDELRQREGDPLLRGRFRALHRDLSRSRMIAAVAEADVVITNPTHFAVALRYDRTNMAAPTVLAKGRNVVAERIRAAAREHDVPIVEDPPLARMLVKSAEIGREIPQNLFQAVAEVLAFVYKLQPRRAREWGVST